MAVVGLDELEVRGVAGARAQQLQVQLAHAATDLEHGGALDAARHAASTIRCSVPPEPAPAVPAGHSAGEPVTEHPVAPPWVAAAVHLPSMDPPGRRPRWPEVPRARTAHLPDSSGRSLAEPAEGVGFEPTMTLPP